MGPSLRRRNFISTHTDDIPLDTIRLVSPINSFAIFQGNFTDDDDYPEKPYKLKTKLIIICLVVLVFVSAVSGYLIGSSDFDARNVSEPPDPVEPQKPSASKLHEFQRAAVCTDAPYCSQVGRDILEKNGSVVDATIAAMLCNGFFNQQSMGLGGGFFMTVYMRDEGRAYSVIAREKAPAAAKVDMFHGDSDKSSKGPLAVGVPGEVRGLWAAHKRWGKLPWESLVAPALKICREGYVMSLALHDGLTSNPSVKNDPNLRKTFYSTSKNDFHKPGTIIKQSEALCNTLQRIAEKGGDELYNGSLSVEFLEDLHNAGSIITAEDLRDYEPKITEPVAVNLRDGDILYTPPLPSSGVILADILNILGGYNFNASSIAQTDEAILTSHRMIEAFKFAYASRTKLGDPDYLDLKKYAKEITTMEHGREVRLMINDSMTSNDPTSYGASEYTKGDGGTAHISIISKNGDAVSVTSSINYFFGAGFTTLKTGIVMNNVMDDFSSPGITNYFGVKPSPPNYIAPGKRPLSSMTPSIIIDRSGNVKLVVGASGGTKITTSVALVIIRKLWLDQTIKEAVDAARFHHQVFPMKIEYEFGVTEDIVKGLKAKGHEMERYRSRGSVICALFKNRTAIYANSDFRKGGDVAGMD